MKKLYKVLQENSIRFAIAYADNNAIGYFEKVGFEMGVEDLKRSAWHKRIYHYSGGQIMSVDLQRIHISKSNSPNGKFMNKVLLKTNNSYSTVETQFNEVQMPQKIITDVKSVQCIHTHNKTFDNHIFCNRMNTNYFRQ